MSMQLSNPKKTDEDNNKYYHYHCLYCHWNSIGIDFKGDNLNNLLIKFNYYKGKYQRSPQSMMFEKLMELYKYNQDQSIQKEKFVLRSKKKTISYLMHSHKKRIKYLYPQFEKDQQD